MDIRRSRPLSDALGAALLGLLVGLALHLLAASIRDHGPSWGNFSLRGSGAIIFLLLAPLAVVIGEVVYARRRAWLAMLLLPLAVFVGLFVILGNI